MSQQVKLIVGCVLLIVALGILSYNLGWITSRGPKPGENKPCEIIHPTTGVRTKTTWLDIFQMAQTSPATAVNISGDGLGGWAAKLPDGKYGWVVNPGETKSPPPPSQDMDAGTPPPDSLTPKQ